MTDLKLRNLPKTLNSFLTLTLFSLLIGMTVGVIYLSQTTHLSPQGTLERFNGKVIDDPLSLETSYPKPLEEMLITTHSHIISFSFIIFIAGSIFYFSSFKEGRIKRFLLYEPPLSAVISFGSIWGFRYIHSSFIYLTIISATLLYSSLYYMILYSMKDLWVNRNKAE